MRIVAPIPKKTLLVRQNLPKKNTKNERRFYTLYNKKLSNLRPPLSIIFPQGFRKSKKLGHWTLGNGGPKTFKPSEETKKRVENFFLPWRFYTLHEQKFSNLRSLLSITFPKVSKNLESLHIGL